MTPLRSTEDLCQHLALEHPQWACSELETLSGGNANLSCRGKLSATAQSVFIKHAEDILGQGWSLPASRAYHEQLLRAKLQEDLPPVSHGATLVGTPKLLSYLPDCHTQMLEDVQAVDLKSYLFKERISAQASLELGQALGVGFNTDAAHDFHLPIVDVFSFRIPTNIYPVVGTAFPRMGQVPSASRSSRRTTR